ncbi:type 1 glutamine amidotransferase family protein [Nocardia brasiliensis]|uniref:type 1 glutamine amidotransferase family protein n=1 Tax=Nocardia brasiliensis TaxID=37326 RepID=UPI0024591039|nr:type 1 glutamine amidotransferase family protein [Nocardia brasiliensis]
MKKRTVHVAVYNTFSDWEIGAATAHINRTHWQKEPGTWQTKTVGPTTAPITTLGGMHVTPEMALADLRPEDSAMLILAGADTWDSEELRPFARKAREFLAAGVPVAAICGATLGLALEGLLDGRKHTSNVREFLLYSGYAGADHYVDEAAVTDGDLITAGGTSPFEFAREVLDKLGVYEPHVLAGWYQLYGQSDGAGWEVLAAYDEQQTAAAAG